MNRAFNLIVAIILVPCVAVLAYHDAAGTLLAAVLMLAIGTWFPQWPVRRIHRAAACRVQVRSHARRVQSERASRTSGGPTHRGSTAAVGFFSKA